MYITFEQRNHYESILRSLYHLLHNYKRGKKQVKRRISGNVEWPRLAEIANVIGLRNGIYFQSIVKDYQHPYLIKTTLMQN